MEDSIKNMFVIIIIHYILLDIISMFLPQLYRRHTAGKCSIILYLMCVYSWRKRSLSPVSSQPSSSMRKVQCLLQTWGYMRTYWASMGGVKELADGVLLSTFPLKICWRGWKNNRWGAEKKLKQISFLASMWHFFCRCLWWQSTLNKLLSFKVNEAELLGQIDYFSHHLSL